MPSPNHVKQARAEIMAILQKHDIGGYVVLHSPGWAELFGHLTPSYSKLSGWPNERGEVRIRSKLVDYNGDKDAQRADLEATANMVSSFADILINGALMFRQLSRFVDAQTGAEHTRGPFEPDPALPPSGDPDP